MFPANEAVVGRSANSIKIKVPWTMYQSYVDIQHEIYLYLHYLVAVGKILRVCKINPPSIYMRPFTKDWKSRAVWYCLHWEATSFIPKGFEKFNPSTAECFEKGWSGLVRMSTIELCCCRQCFGFHYQQLCMPCLVLQTCLFGSMPIWSGILSTSEKSWAMINLNDS